LEDLRREHFHQASLIDDHGWTLPEEVVAGQGLEALVSGDRIEVSDSQIGQLAGKNVRYVFKPPVSCIGIDEACETEAVT